MDKGKRTMKYTDDNPEAEPGGGDLAQLSLEGEDALDVVETSRRSACHSGSGSDKSAPVR